MKNYADTVKKSVETFWKKKYADRHCEEKCLDILKKRTKKIVWRNVLTEKFEGNCSLVRKEITEQT